MMKKWDSFYKIILGAIGLFILTLPMAQAEPATEDIILGTQWMGDPITAKDLTNHVIAVEFTGMHWQGCVADIPHLVKWYEQYNSKGLILLGFNVQGGSKDENVDFFKSHGVKYPIFQSGQIKGINVRGIPHFCLFDYTGKLIFEGFAKGADKKLAEIMSTTLESIVSEGSYKKLQPLVKTITQHKDLGKITAQLRTKTADNKDEDEAAEATELLKGLTRYADYLKKQAASNKDEHPSQCYNTYQRLANEFKGDDIGTEANNELEALKKDKTFQDNLEADKKLMAINDIVSKLKPCQSNKPLDIKRCAACRKKNQADLDTITTLSKDLISKYPESPAAKKVKDGLTGLGIEIK